MYSFVSSPRSSKAEKRQWRSKLVLKIVSLVTLTVTMVGLYSLYSTELSGQALVLLLNNRSLSWTAGFNNISGQSSCRTGDVLKVQRSSRREASLFRLQSISLLEAPYIPTVYDFRDQYPLCQNLHASCSPSWADTVASAASDRLCVASGVSVKVRLWAPVLTSCCPLCQGPLHAWLYLSARGFPEVHQDCPEEGVSCGNNSLSEKFGVERSNHTSLDIHYGVSAFLLPQSVESIQLEMMRNGPVVAVLDVYSDFFYYKSGLYQYKYGSYQGSMAVKIIGWGNQAGLDYWLAVTSWSHHWGDRGTFKIRRGTNECKVEADVTAGHMLPR